MGTSDAWIVPRIGIEERRRVGSKVATGDMALESGSVALLDAPVRIPAQKAFDTIEWTGNTSAATIPIGMHEAHQAGVLQSGMPAAVAVFGSRLTWGSMLPRW